MNEVTKTEVRFRNRLWSVLRAIVFICVIAFIWQGMTKMATAFVAIALIMGWFKLYQLRGQDIEKPYYKEKIRLRSYFSPAKPDDKVFLEIKKKVGGIVTKRRVTMTLTESDAYLLQKQKPVDLTKYLQKQIFSELDVFLENYPVIPKQYISYQRSAFFGKDDPDFRLTFDRQITERRYDLSLALPSYGAQIIAPNQRLMEVKIAGAMPLWLSQKLSELKIYKISFSKYGRAYQRYIRNKLYNEGYFKEKKEDDVLSAKPIIQKTNSGYYENRKTAGGVILP